ncbi:MAG: hypothetical protein RIT27_1907 [Pseudomonadota bacterium]|jgi:IS30 family transposase
MSISYPVISELLKSLTEGTSAMPHAPIDEQFNKAENSWDLNRLYKDLASAKGKKLTPTEKLHLRGLLCGHSPTEIANKLNKSKNSVEVDLSSTIYQYIKSLLNRENKDIGNWRDISEWLEEAGYKSAFMQGNLNIPETVDALVKMVSFNIKNNKIIIDLNVRIVSPLADKNLQAFLEKQPDDGEI